MSFFSITIDTEADDAWNNPKALSLKNFNAIPRFQNLCEKYDIIPTYLLTYEYANFEPAIKFFKKKAEEKKCEIGYHLHVWSTPPFKNEQNGVDIDYINAYQFEIDDDIFFKKANTLFDVIYENFGIKPLSHRAGRYGLDQRTIDWLCEKKFIVETSVVPMNNFKNSMGLNSKGPNFTYNKLNINKISSSKSNDTIVEFPVSVMSSNFIPRNFLDFSLLRKIFRKFGFTKMLRPYPNNLKNNISIINYYLKNNIDINYMLHSSELELNCSPISMNENDLKKIWNNIEICFKLLKMNQVKSLGISEIAYEKFNV